MTVLDEKTDEELMLAYAAGDLPSFERLFRRHRRPLFTYLRHRVGERAVAEDLFQEVFLRVVRNRRRYRPTGTFRAWLFTITHNVVTDQRRRAALRTESSEGETMNSDDRATGRGSTDRTSRRVDDPLASSQAGELRASIEAALARIPDEQREVFLLRERAGLDYRSIAEITGDALATVKSRMRYALANLRVLLPEALATPAESSHE